MHVMLDDIRAGAGPPPPDGVLSLSAQALPGVPCAGGHEPAVKKRLERQRQARAGTA